MTKGFQDWDVPVNINTQQLAEIINRPKYGSAQRGSAVYQGTDSGLQSIITISGTGVIYGGYLYALAAGNISGGLTHIIIDDIIVFASQWDTLQQREITNLYASFGILLQYDTALNRYTLGLTNFITFESSYEIQYSPSTTDTTTVRVEIAYATI